MRASGQQVKNLKLHVININKIHKRSVNIQFSEHSNVTDCYYNLITINILQRNNIQGKSEVQKHNKIDSDKKTAIKKASDHSDVDILCTPVKSHLFI